MSSVTHDAVLQELRTHAIAVATAAEDQRADGLAMRLRRVASASLPLLTVAVVGERSRGKSTLLNALLQLPELLPTDVDVTTNSHVTVRAPAAGTAERDHARVFYVNGEHEDIDLDDLVEYVSEFRNADNFKGVQRVEVAVESPLLAEGFCFLDTPGVGGLLGAHGRKTRQAVIDAEALIMVLEADRPISEPELKFISELTDSVQHVIFVHNARDEDADPAEVLRFNRSAIAEHSSELASCPLVVVSAYKAERAWWESPTDPDYANELLTESNIGTLEALLRSNVREAILTDWAALILARTAYALQELARPLRQQVGIKSGAEKQRDISRIERELQFLQERSPQDRLDRRLENAKRQVAAEFLENLESVRGRLSDRVDASPPKGLSAVIANQLQLEVDALWGRSVARFQTLAAQAVSDVFDDFGLGSTDFEADPGPTQTATAAQSQTDPEPTGASSVLGNVARLVGFVAEALFLAFGGIQTAVGPVAVVGIMFQKQRQAQMTEERAKLKQAVDSRVGSAQTVFTTKFDEHTSVVRDRAADLVVERYDVRIGSLQATLGALQQPDSGLVDGDRTDRDAAQIEALEREQRRLESRYSVTT